MSLKDQARIVNPVHKLKFKQWPRKKVVVEFSPQLIELIGTPTVYGEIGRSQMNAIAEYFEIEFLEAVEIHFLYSTQLNIIH